jgi:parvulin-like peptidyl-prolyl isomerase
MAKRRQTTGLPKQQSPAPQSPQEPRRERKSRAEREADIQRRVLIGTGVTVAIVVLILVAAVVIELFVTPNQVVASVNGENITVAQFQDRVRLERALLNLQINNYISNIQALGLDPNQFAGEEPLRTWLSQVQIPDQLGNSVVQTMVSDALVRQQAQALGVTVNQEQIDARIEGFLGFDPDALTEAEATETVEPTVTPTPFVSPTPSPTPLPTATPEATEEATEEATAESTDAPEATPTYTPVPATPTQTADEQIAEFQTLQDDFFTSITNSARISRDQLTSYFEGLALRDALRDQVSELTSDLLHVDARHILVATEEEALDIKASLEAGESFAGLAQASSTDTGSGANGGELGWSPVTNFVGPFSEAVTNGEIGALLGPVETEFGWHIIQIHGREVRPVEDDALETAKNAEFQSWLETQREAQQDNITINSVWADHVPDEPAFILTSGI